MRERVCIVGLGALGSSLARDLRAIPDPPVLIGTDRDPGAMAAAERDGVLDELVHDSGAAVASAGLVLYATPLRGTLGLLRRHGPLLPPDAVVTDVVSLKDPLMRAAGESGLSTRFVGGHPMAGTERSGWPGGRAGIFRGARVWITPGAAAPPAVERVEGLWRSVGALPARIDAGRHDETMVWVSHLPQLLANLLAGSLDARDLSPSTLGPGGRDMVRLAGSSPGLWGELLAESGPAAAAALRSIGRGADALADLLEGGDLSSVVRFMERTREWRGTDA